MSDDSDSDIQIIDGWNDNQKYCLCSQCNLQNKILTEKRSKLELQKTEIIIKIINIKNINTIEYQKLISEKEEIDLQINKIDKWFDK